MRIRAFLVGLIEFIRAFVVQMLLSCIELAFFCVLGDSWCCCCCRGWVVCVLALLAHFGADVLVFTFALRVSKVAAAVVIFAVVQLRCTVCEESPFLHYVEMREENRHQMLTIFILFLGHILYFLLSFLF